ncbi:RagB/SusD family nutrient uptake outer membrane protein [Salmonirosea aquatica]|uniref:RagB/SusD family nutrient uptake outer membrane protein n=1 Tax=Salmonirosea aquatica TaxID=2654236 RepID=A0A7C9BSY7_9BACT|nr:RagB/SusD family nutrient uptake outer membrane protein [Cytophagaceae bacterium SJW1-29]
MKKYSVISLFAFAFTILIYASCNEKRLDLQPLSPTEASYFTEESDFNKSVLGIYAKLTDFYWFNANSPIHGFWQLPGDDITSTGTYAFEIFGTLQPSTSQNQVFYRTAYQLINRANTTLQKLDEESGIIQTPNLKNSFRGEALFLRGYTNFLLWNYYGTAPLITERIQTPDQTTPPSSKDTELIDQAIKDLTEAATLLPAAWDDMNRGRVTSNSANGMLGKALVFRGSVKKNTTDYTAAIAAFNKITGVRLVADFNDNFDAKTENNAESLFEFQASQPDNDNVWLANDFQRNGVGSTSGFWGWYEGSSQLGGQPRYTATQKLVNAFEAGDPRIASTLDPQTLIFYKYWHTGDQKSQSGVASVNNARILRYSDVLLLKAEAILESGGSTAEAIGLINQIRTRAREMVPNGTVPANFSTTETDKAKIFDWIMAERFRELAGEEGARWFDLRRWHLGGKINLATWDWSSARNDVSFDVNKNLYYPIPDIETNLNPNIVQNPGY